MRKLSRTRRETQSECEKEEEAVEKIKHILRIGDPVPNFCCHFAVVLEDLIEFSKQVSNHVQHYVTVRTPGEKV